MAPVKRLISLIDHHFCDLFVIGLALRVDQLQDADLEDDLALLEHLAIELGKQATRLGYAPLFEISRAVALACRDGKAQDAQTAMIVLTEIAGRIRSGHRGAA